MVEYLCSPHDSRKQKEEKDGVSVSISPSRVHPNDLTFFQ
jgi:hypothetical protein